VGVLDVFRQQNAKRFPRKGKSSYERDLKKTGEGDRGPHRCCVCGCVITGRALRVSDRKWSCVPCANESG